MPSWLDYLFSGGDQSGAPQFSAQRGSNTSVFGDPLSVPAPGAQIPPSYGQLNNQGGLQPVNPQVPTSYLDQLRARTPPIMPRYPDAPFAGATTDASSGYEPYQPPVQSGGSQIPYRYGYVPNPPPPAPVIPPAYGALPNNPGGNIPADYGRLPNQPPTPAPSTPYPQVQPGYPTDPRVPIPPVRPADLAGSHPYPQVAPGYPVNRPIQGPPMPTAAQAARPGAAAPAAAVTRPPLPPVRPPGFGVAPIPPARPPGFGAPVAAAQPVQHVAAPAWLGNLIRAGQPATGMTGMVRGGNLMDNRQ